MTEYADAITLHEGEEEKLDLNSAPSQEILK